jgi:hypothetical protein
MSGRRRQCRLMLLAGGGDLRHDHVMMGSEPWQPRRQAVVEPFVALAATGFVIMPAIKSSATSAAYIPGIAVLAVGLAVSFARSYLAVRARFAGLTPRLGTGQRQVAWHASFAV